MTARLKPRRDQLVDIATRLTTALLHGANVIGPGAARAAANAAFSAAVEIAEQADIWEKAGGKVPIPPAAPVTKTKES